MSKEWEKVNKLKLDYEGEGKNSRIGVKITPEQCLVIIELAKEEAMEEKDYAFAEKARMIKNLFIESFYSWQRTRKISAETYRELKDYLQKRFDSWERARYFIK